MEKLRISGVVDDSIVDGKGMRYTIFTQGCPHGCPGCQNPQTHDFAGGTLVEWPELLEEILDNPMLKGVTFSGGEPFCQAGPLAELAQQIHERSGGKLDITVFTGFTWEELREKHDPGIEALLAQTDVLIDGRYEAAQKDLTLTFRGSRNQRVIDVQASLERGVLAELGAEQGY